MDFRKFLLKGTIVNKEPKCYEGLDPDEASKEESEERTTIENQLQLRLPNSPEGAELLKLSVGGGLGLRPLILPEM